MDDFERYQDEPKLDQQEEGMAGFSLLRLPSKVRRRARRSRIMTLLILACAICTFVLPIYWIYKPPAFLINHFAQRWPDVLWQVKTDEKVVALTIDDAPSEYSKEIMEVLQQSGAKATFFVIGAQASGREKTLQELVLGDMELGNHAMHDEPSRSLAEKTLVDQVKLVDWLIGAAYTSAGKTPPPKYFRPGSGFFSTGMRKTIKDLGYRMVLGGIYPHDPQISLPHVNAKHIVSMLRPGGIIICHDRRSWTVPMLKEAIPLIKKAGYRITTLSELLKLEEKQQQ